MQENRFNLIKSALLAGSVSLTERDLRNVRLNFGGFQLRGQRSLGTIHENL